MRSSLLFGFIVAVFSSIPSLRAEDKKPDPAPAPAPAAPATTAAKAVDPKSVDELRANEQQIVTIKGKVTRSKDWDGNGTATKAMNFIDLEGGYFTAVTFASDFDKFKSHPAVLYKDKTIEITGKLETRNGRWQIKLTSPDQVKVIEAEAKADPKDEKKDAATKPGAAEPGKDGDAKDEKTEKKDDKKRVDSKKFFK